MGKQSISEVAVHRIVEACSTSQRDSLAVEEPLEIRLGYEIEGKRTSQSVSITMRTPDDDFELAAGFLFTENIIRRSADIKRIFHCGAPLEGSAVRNTVRVDLRAGVFVDLKRLERHFYTTSSCGVCGKTSIDALQISAPPHIPLNTPIISATVIHNLPSVLRRSQEVFASTGGLHAAALFDQAGNLIAVREDVGRHNALDKLIGSQLLSGQLPLRDKLILLSGRVSFELIQKALVAGVPVVAAVGAPSSLAVTLAREFGMTLLGFVRDQRFNIYAGAERIHEAAGQAEMDKTQVVRASVIG